VRAECEYTPDGLNTNISNEVFSSSKKAYIFYVEKFLYVGYSLQIF
jgi:hypothetical protein